MALSAGLLNWYFAELRSAHEVRHRYRAVQLCRGGNPVGEAQQETTGNVDTSIIFVLLNQE